jgi:hypothetical protein
MAKQVAKSGVLVLLMACLLSACASSGDETTGNGLSSRSTATVPGEKMSGDEGFAPGPPGSSGSVRW